MPEQTTVEYNGITINNCLTRSFRQEPVMDPSDTDLEFFKYTIRVVGYVHTDGGASVRTNISPVDGADAASQHIYIRGLLLEPRGYFKMRTGADFLNAGAQPGVVLLQADPSKASSNGTELKNIDLNNGPKTRVFEVTQIAGNKLFRVEVEFELCTVQCGGEAGITENDSGVLSNRWSVTDEIDQNFMTTRTFNGRLRAATSVVNVNSFRALIAPPLSGGFRRDRMTFTATEDGLALAYTIVDREVAFSPPAPATSWSYTHKESTASAKMVTSEVTVSLGGDRNAQKHLLIAIGISIVEAKLITGEGAADHVIEDLSVSDHYGDNTNRVDVYCRVKRTKDLTEVRGIVTKGLGRPLTGRDFVAAGFTGLGNYDSNRSRGGYPADVTEIKGPVGMVAAATTKFQEPCKSLHDHETLALAPQQESGNKDSGTTIRARVVGELTGSRTDYLSESHTEAMYTTWIMESLYHTNYHKVQLPVAGRDQEFSDGDPTSVVIPLTRPTTTRTIRIRGHRHKQPPILPRPEELVDFNGGDQVLLWWKVKPVTPDRGRDGTLEFRVEAEYHYAITNPPKFDTKLPIGINPWESTTVARNGHKTTTKQFDGKFV